MEKNSRKKIHRCQICKEKLRPRSEEEPGRGSTCPLDFAMDRSRNVSDNRCFFSLDRVIGPGIFSPVKMFDNERLTLIHGKKTAVTRKTNVAGESC